MLLVLWLGASERRERVSCCRNTELLLSFADPWRDGHAEWTWINHAMRKSPTYRNYAVTQVSATEFEPETVQLRM